jgi:hypothetical protein
MPDGESELLVISTETEPSVRRSGSSLSLVGASLSSDGRFVAYEKARPATGFPDYLHSRLTLVPTRRWSATVERSIAGLDA